VKNEYTDKAHQRVCDLLSALLPGDRGHVVLVFAYFDESSTQDDAPSLVVAGYVFRPSDYRAFDWEWGEALALAGVPYWHTVRAMGKPSGPFEGKAVEEVAELGAKCRNLIHRYARVGVGVSVTQSEFDALAPDGWIGRYGGAYTAALQWCLAGIREWADANDVDGVFAYFFEAGNEFQKEANDRMNLIYNDLAKRAEYRHDSHTFADGTRHHGLQAADMFAWHFARLFNKSYLGGARLRPDTKHLFNGRADLHKTYRITAEKLKQWFDAHANDLPGIGP
jgi:hypothetical protein